MRKRGGRLRAPMASLLVAVALAAVGTACGGGDGGPEVDKTIPVGQDPTDVVAAYGSVWVASGAVTRLDPEKNALALKNPILTGEAPDAIAAGGDRVWVAHTLGRSVAGIDPRTDKVVESVEVASRATDVIYGEGSVWVSLGPAHKVQRVDPARRRAITPTIETGLGPAGLAAGAGSIWVANQFDYTVSRIDPATNKVVATIKVGIQPTDLAMGEGALWVTNSNDDSVMRIDPATNRVVATIRLEGTNPTDIAVGLGAVWVAQATSNTLARIDPDDNKQTDELPLERDAPLDIATGFGAIWMPIAESEFVMRVNP
jgi:virginiamycin B lyase